MITVLPGDNVTKHLASTTVPKIGTGLRMDESSQQIYATQAGTLERGKTTAKHQVYFVRTNLRRYRPAVEDRVIGIIQERAGPDGAGGDLYRVHINASHPATLSNLQFEGATKRNKPAFRTGQLIYARVANIFQHVGYSLDPTLSCINGPNDEGIPRKDWMTNEGCYGELKGGTCCSIPTGLARQLLYTTNTVLTCLSETKIPFEVAIGVNGMLWVHSVHPLYTVMVQNAIQNSHLLTQSQVKSMVLSLKETADQQIRLQEQNAPKDDDDDMGEEDD